jgi:hypothetical protein
MRRLRFKKETDFLFDNENIEKINFSLKCLKKNKNKIKVDINENENEMLF